MYRLLKVVFIFNFRKKEKNKSDSGQLIAVHNTDILSYTESKISLNISSSCQCWYQTSLMKRKQNV